MIPATSPALKARIAYLFREATGGYAWTTLIETALLPRLGAGPLFQQVVPIRYAYGADGSIWVDLAGKPSRYAHVTKSHVTVEASCRIAFYRPATVEAMPAAGHPEGRRRVQDRHQRGGEALPNHARADRDRVRVDNRRHASGRAPWWRQAHRVPPHVHHGRARVGKDEFRRCARRDHRPLPAAAREAVAG